MLKPGAEEYLTRVTRSSGNYNEAFSLFHSIPDLTDVSFNF